MVCAVNRAVLRGFDERGFIGYNSALSENSKGAAIRAYHRQGKTAKEIISMGYKSATVYDAIRRIRRRADRRLLEEIHTIVLEVLKQVRGTELPE